MRATHGGLLQLTHTEVETWGWWWVPESEALPHPLCVGERVWQVAQTCTNMVALRATQAIKVTVRAASFLEHLFCAARFGYTAAPHRSLGARSPP